MSATPLSFKKIFLAIAAAIGWFGLILQLYLVLTLKDSPVSFWGRFFNFFSYFTVLTNILAALSLTFTFLNAQSKIGLFFRNPVVQSAIAMNIVIVGIVYITVLQKLWQPKGLNWLADFTLHYAMPFLYAIYWLAFVPKGQLQWKHCFTWLIYPAIYFAYSIIRGPIVNWYPYPFVDVGAIGYIEVFKNSAVLMGAFIVAGFIFLAIDSLLANKVKVAQ
jgi:hypothetical protein